MIKYFLQFCEKVMSGEIWGALGGLLAILSDVGSKLRCLGSMLELCCYIFGSIIAAGSTILAIKNAEMSQDGAQEAAKFS